MDENDKKEFLDDFRKAVGPRKLDMWYYALEQEVAWEKLLTEMSTISKEQKVDKQLDKMMEDDLKHLEE